MSHKFKVGDWVILESSPYAAPEQITEVVKWKTLNRWAYKTTHNFGLHPSHWLGESILVQFERDSILVPDNFFHD